MNILILGAGQVGTTAAYSLAREEANEVTIVDRDPEVLRELQDLLGHIQDVTATAQLLNHLEPPKKRAPSLQRGAGIVAGWQASAEQVTRKQLMRTWAEFEKHEPFWT